MDVQERQSRSVSRERIGTLFCRLGFVYRLYADFDRLNPLPLHLLFIYTNRLGHFGANLGRTRVHFLYRYLLVTVEPYGLFRVNWVHIFRSFNFLWIYRIQLYVGLSAASHFL